MPMPGTRTQPTQTSPDNTSAGTKPYRYGFGGQESDFEINNSGGTSYTAEFWQYDARLGRRWNVDPETYIWQSPYACFNNNPINYNDPIGEEGEEGKDGEKGKTKLAEPEHVNPEIKQGEKYNVVFFPKYNALKKDDAIRDAYLNSVESQKSNQNLLIYFTGDDVFNNAEKELRSVYDAGASIKNVIFNYHGNPTKATVGHVSNLNQSISALKKIGSYMDNNGVIIIATCHTGKFDSFLGKIAKNTGRNVLANKSFSIGASMFRGWDQATNHVDLNHPFNVENSYAYNNAGFWTLARPSPKLKSGYQTQTVPVISIDSKGNFKFNKEWKEKHPIKSNVKQK